MAIFSRKESVPEGNRASEPKSPAGLVSIKGKFHQESENEIESRLSGGRYKREFYKMSLSDPICGAILLSLTKIFQSADWKAINDEKGILKKSLENVNWKAQLEDILTQFIFGYSVIEVTLKEDEDGDVVWNKMYYRPQTTLDEWLYDREGNLTYVRQQSYNKHDPTGQVYIPLHKCLHFKTTSTSNNPEGKSLFRNAYRDWYYKSNIEQIEAIGVERDLTGLPVLKAPEDIELTDEKGNLNAIGTWAYTTVRNIKRNSQEGLVLPSGWEFHLAGSPGQRQFDLNDVINRYGNNIALSMLSQFLVLGVTNESGSFALAKEQSALFYIAVQGFADMLAEVVNTQFIGTKCLQKFNRLEKQPKLIPVGIEQIDTEDLGAFLARVLKFNLITPDDRLEEFIRNKIALPPREPETARSNDNNPSSKDNIIDEDDIVTTNDKEKENERQSDN
jgi:hypothetical protein